MDQVQTKHSIVTVKYSREDGSDRTIKLFYPTSLAHPPRDLLKDARREDPALQTVHSIRVIPATKEQIALFDLAVIVVSCAQLFKSRPPEEKKQSTSDQEYLDSHVWRYFTGEHVLRRIEPK